MKTTEPMTKCDNPHQELSMQELTERFYAVRSHRDRLIACIQKIQRIAWDRERGGAEKDHDIEKVCEEARQIVLFSKSYSPESNTPPASPVPLQLGQEVWVRGKLIRLGTVQYAWIMIGDRPLHVPISSIHPAPQSPKCSRCGGSGKVLQSIDGGPNSYAVPCSECSPQPAKKGE